MNCIPKSIVQFMTRSKGDKESLLAKEVKPDFKILLVGESGSGKTTFLKQAKLKHGKGFSNNDRTEYRKVMINNFYKTATNLFDSIKELKMEDGLDEMLVQEITKQSEEWTDSIPTKHAGLVKRVWKEPKVKELYTEQYGGGEYYLNQVSRIANPNYIPTIHEMMSIELPTTVPRSQIIRVNGLNFEVTDTPGCEENDVSGIVTRKYDFVIYFVSLSEFRTVNTETEMELISENISNLRKVAKSIGKETTILLYFTQTHEYIMTQKYTQTDQNIDYFCLSKHLVMKYFAKLIDSLPNNVYNFFEETNKLNNMKLVYELMKHEEIVKNLKNINLD